MGRALDASENWGYENSNLLMCVWEAREKSFVRLLQNLNS